MTDKVKRQEDLRALMQSYPNAYDEFKRRFGQSFLTHLDRDEWIKLAEDVLNEMGLPTEWDEPSLVVYIATDADYWGDEPTQAEIDKLTGLVKQVAKEQTNRLVRVEAMPHPPFSRTTVLHGRERYLADDILEEAWKRMFAESGDRDERKRSCDTRRM